MSHSYDLRSTRKQPQETTAHIDSQSLTSALNVDLHAQMDKPTGEQQLRHSSSFNIQIENNNGKHKHHQSSSQEEMALAEDGLCLINEEGLDDRQTEIQHNSTGITQSGEIHGDMRHQQP
ncbi:unnamed protein product, partial [Didymodactylos carnosus]